jgi:dethiobiotin synthetase
MVMNKRYFVAGIGTGVGKTVASAILCKALRAAYWKPLQSGDLEFSDTDRVNTLLNDETHVSFSEAYRLPYPVSPHASAERAGLTIEVDNINVPQHDGCLIIEGAGGLMVPLHYDLMYLDIIPRFEAEVILVSQHYLGSINHTLLSIEALKSRNIKVKGILFNGREVPETEKVISNYSPWPVLGRIDETQEPDAAFVHEQALKFVRL